MQTTFVGIDPGKNGAMAILRNCNQPSPMKVTLVEFDAANYILSLKGVAANFFNGLYDADSTVMIEKVWAMPHEGVSSAFSFGENFGFITGIVKALGFYTDFVTPRVWQKHFGISGSKQEHIAKAKELFPGIDLRRTPRCKKEHDGFADALLIAEYARQTSQTRQKCGITQ